MAAGSHGQAGCGQQAGGGGVQAASLVPSPMEDLFKQVKFYIVGDVDPEVVRLLRAGSAKEVSYNALATHIVTSEADHTDVSEAREVFDLPVVKPSWVTLSVRCGVLLPVNGFSPEAGQPFSGVTACLSQISSEDRSALWAMLTFYGGVCQLVLNKNCSHLVVPEPTGAKYECALKHASRIKIVTPDWVLDSVSAKGRQAEGSYHPRLVVHPLPDGMTENGDAEMHSEEEETEEGDNVEEEIRKQELEHQMRHVLSATAAERRRVASACLPVHFSSDDSSSGHSSPTRVPEGSPSSLSEPMSHRSLTCLKASPHFPALATQSPAVQPSGLLPAQPLQNRTTTLQAHLALLTGARVPSLHGLNLPLPRTPALAPQNNSVLSCPRLPMVPALPTELRLQGVIMSSSGAATMVPAASGARVFGAGADVRTSGPLMGRTSLSTDFGVMSPMVRTLRNITNSAEVQHSSRLSNVAHVLQSMSVPTRALDLRPSEARSLESSYLNTRDQDSVPSQPRDCITEPPPACHLLGCIFAFADYPERVLDKQLIGTWKKVIHQNGGLVDSVLSPRCTHLLCESQTSATFKQALREGKRCVTIHWLNDILKHGHMAPYRALHLPTAFAPEARPCTNHIVSVTGFMDRDREEVKLMVRLIGARYTGYLTRSNTLLICKEPCGMKYEKAREWRIPCVNVAWLCAVMAGSTDAIQHLQHERFSLYNLLEAFAPERHLLTTLLAAWKNPIQISRDALIASRNISRRKLSELSCHQAPKKPRLDERPPSIHKLPPDRTPHVIFTGFNSIIVQEYMKKLYVLGGEVAESSAKCTHLVAAKVIRTVKFLVSLPTVQNIVTSEWLEQSFRAQYFLDPRIFPLRDAEAEVEFNFTLEESMRKAQTRRIFQGLHFYITPGICPSLSTMRTIADAGDGRLLPKQPSWQQVFDHQRGKSLPEIVIISCSNDLHLCKNYFAHSIDVHNGEFILTGMITQKLDYETFRFTLS